MRKIDEMARELGEALGRTDEYQALRRAVRAVDDDREMAKLRTALEEAETEVMTRLRSGQQVDDLTRSRYEKAAEKLQVRPEYQRLVAAQANFDKVLGRVNDTIASGIETGAAGRIILAT